MILIVASFCVFDRRYITYIQCKREYPWTISDGDIQFVVWNHFGYLFLLRRNAHLSWNNDANGGICSYIVTEKSEQWQ